MRYAKFVELLPVFGAFVLATLLGPPSARAATEVTTCGQVVSGTAFLNGDLDCTGLASPAVTLDGGKFDLQGHTLTSDQRAIGCNKSCRIYSSVPGGVVYGTIQEWLGDASLRVLDLDVFGEVLSGLNVTVINSVVSGSSFDGVVGKRVKVINSLVTGHGDHGVRTGTALIKDSVVSSNAGDAVVSGGSIVLRNSNVQNNGGYGVSGSRVNVKESLISGNGNDGIAGGDNLKLLDSTVTMNAGNGVSGDKMSIRGTTVADNLFSGIVSTFSKLKLSESTVSGNGLHGVFRDYSFGCDAGIKLHSSTLTGNGTDIDCGSIQTCADVSTCSVPTLTASTCETSYDSTSGFPGTSWGICALD